MSLASIAIPFLVLLLAGAFAAYHRFRLAVWAALTATLLVACWLLGASAAATVIAALIVAWIAVPLLVPQIRKPYITAPLLKFYRRSCRRCRRPNASRWNRARWVSKASCSRASLRGRHCCRSRSRN